LQEHPCFVADDVFCERYDAWLGIVWGFEHLVC
jgi:hypothetical protein